MENCSAVVIQLNSGLSVSENLFRVESLLESNLVTEADIILLPEYFAMLGGPQKNLASDNQQIRNWMSSISIKQKSWLVGGSLPVPNPCDGRCHSSCFVYNPSGNEVACYNKMHLFDVNVADNKTSYRESNEFIPGDKPVLVDAKGLALGLSICYDLRFPELYRHLAKNGARILCIPSAFTHVTGAAHWTPLLQARAIENQCYVLAANQTGMHPDGRQTWGHSMIISPWGEVLAQATEDKEVVVQSMLDFEYQNSIRQQMPCLDHRRL